MTDSHVGLNRESDDTWDSLHREEPERKANCGRCERMAHLLEQERKRAQKAERKLDQAHALLQGLARDLGAASTAREAVGIIRGMLTVLQALEARP